MITTIVSIVGVLYALWLLFILAMSFKRVWPNLGAVAKALAAPVIIIGFMVDVLVNVASSVVFLDLPRELTLSRRLKRYHYNADHPWWRRRIADFVCQQMLDKFDPDGDHC